MITKTATITAALRKLNNPQPTAVPMQFAVSFAPIFQPTYAPAPSNKIKIGSIKTSPPMGGCGPVPAKPTVPDSSEPFW